MSRSNLSYIRRLVVTSVLVFRGTRFVFMDGFRKPLTVSPVPQKSGPGVLTVNLNEKYILPVKFKI